MAAPSGQLKASRYFAALLAIIAVIYALVFFTGDKKPTPKLGLDLQGGTSMTLSASTAGNATPDEKSMEQAREIIADRVDLTGVNEPEVVIEGDNNIVVNVAGGMEEDELRELVAPAKLLFRKVTASTTDISPSATSTTSSASASASTRRVSLREHGPVSLRRGHRERYRAPPPPPLTRPQRRPLTARRRPPLTAPPWIPRPVPRQRSTPILRLSATR